MDVTPDDDRTTAARVAAALDVPLARGLGLSLLEPDEPARGVRLAVADLALNGAGGAHSAALAAAVEAAGYLAVLPHLAEQEHAVTHAFSLSLVRAAPTGAVVEVRGEVDRRTTRMAFVTVVARVDGRPVARAQLVKSVVALS